MTAPSAHALNTYLAAHGVPGSTAHDAAAGVHRGLHCGSDGQVRLVTLHVDPGAPVLIGVGGTPSGCDERAAHREAGAGRRDSRTGASGVAVPGPGTAGGPAPTLEGSTLERPLGMGTDAAFAAARRWAGTDVDVTGACAHSAGDPVVGPLAGRLVGLPLAGSLNAFTLAVTTVLGQQVSTAAARTFAGRLVDAYGGTPHGDLRVFPGAETLAAVGAGAIRDALGLTSARARTVWTLACAAARDGAPDHTWTAADARAWLTALPGIGPWTAEYVALRAVRDLDAFPASDLVLRRALGVRTAAQAIRAAEPWRPWRGYAAYLLWVDAGLPRGAAADQPAQSLP